MRHEGRERIAYQFWYKRSAEPEDLHVQAPALEISQEREEDIDVLE